MCAQCFPAKLHSILRETSKDPILQQVISWNGQIGNGTSFKVYNQELFLQLVLPKMECRMTKYRSFLRQLNLYGFQRVIERSDPLYGSCKFLM